MIIKDKFTILKDVPNILHLNNKEIKEFSVEKGPRNLFVVIELNKDTIKHFAKDSVLSLVSNLEKRKKIIVVNIPNYSLHISYNKPSDQMVFNLTPYDVDNIYTNNIDFKNIYAQLVYGLTFYNLVTEKFNVKQSYFAPISNFLLSMFVSIFGKEYGLLGAYTANITKLNFLINCYVLSAFFGITGKKLYKNSSVASGFNYKEIEESLDNYDFSNIEIFIKSLSDFRVFPGMNKYSFTGKMVRMTGVNFLPALEDLSRFISIMTCIDIKGSSIISTYISKYDSSSFNRIIEISKLIFK
jgi:hypothetical protein